MKSLHIILIITLNLSLLRAQDFYNILWTSDTSNTPVKDTSGTGQTPNASGASDSSGEHTFSITTSNMSSTQRQEWKYDRRAGFTRMQLKFKVSSDYPDFHKIAVAQCHDDQTGSAGVFSIYQVRKEGDLYFFGVQGDTTEASNSYANFPTTEIMLDTWYHLDIKTHTEGVSNSYEYAVLSDEGQTTQLWDNMLTGGGDHESYYKLGVYKLTNGYGPVSVSFTDLSLEQGNAIDSSENLTLTMGQELLLDNNLTNQDITYESSDTTVAVVDNNGLVTTVAPGSVSILTLLENGEVLKTSYLTILPSSDTINIALGKNVIGIEDQSHNPPSHLTDGQVTNRYSVMSFPQDIIIDLESQYYLSRSELITYDARDYKYRVSVSDSLDGPYVEVVDRSDNSVGGTNSSPLIDALNAIGRYVKITVEGVGSSYSGDWISLQEFRVFGETLSPYASWLSSYEVADASPHRDDDKDGIPNIIEYAIGRPPNVKDEGIELDLSIDEEAMVASFLRDPQSLVDTTHYFEYSKDLINWVKINVSDASASNVALETLSESQELVEVTTDYNQNLGECFFWKLTVEIKE